MNIPLDFNHFLTSYILPYPKVEGKCLSETSQKIQEIFQDAKVVHEKNVISVFKAFAHKTKKSIQGSSNDKVLLVRDVLLLTKNFGLLDTFKDLSIKKVINCICDYLGIREEEELSTDYELVLFDFKECMYRCSKFSCSILLEEIEKLKLEGLPVAIRPSSNGSLSMDVAPLCSNPSLKQKRHTKNLEIAKKEAIVAIESAKNILDKPIVEELVLENGKTIPYQVLQEKLQQLQKRVNLFYDCMHENHKLIEKEKMRISIHVCRSTFKFVLTEMEQKLKSS